MGRKVGSSATKSFGGASNTRVFIFAVCGGRGAGRGGWEVVAAAVSVMDS